VIHALHDGRADLGLVTNVPPATSDMEIHSWREDRLVVAVPIGHPLAARDQVHLTDILDHPLIGVQTGGALAAQLADEAQSLGRPLQYRFQVATPDAGRVLVASGLGVSVTPESLVRPFAEALGMTWVPIDEAWAREAGCSERQIAELVTAGVLSAPPAPAAAAAE